MKSAVGLAALGSLALLVVTAGCAPTVPPNVCSTNNGGCDSHAFCSTNGSATVCTCMPGYGGTGQSCTPLSPCDESGGGCDPNATCSVEGTFSVCRCKSGYLGDGYHCEVAPTCNVNNGGCDPNATCAESDGMVSCTCDTGAGYVGNGTICRTCSGDSPCGANSMCQVNTAANSITCTCETGYVPAPEGSGCVPENNCVPDPCGSPYATCLPTSSGPPVCICDSGYLGDGGVCVAITTCAVDNGGCDPLAKCTNMSAGAWCACPNGFTTDDDGGTCTSQVCEAHLDDCAREATCADSHTAAGFTCACDPGFEGDGGMCTLVDNCTPNPCKGVNETCEPNTPTPTTYTCVCASGYSEQSDGDGGTSCQPENACAGSPCKGAHEVCKSTGPDKYECDCATNYQLEATDGGESCEPIDACLSNPCPQNANCTDTGPNTYTCACKTGYQMSGSQCLAVDVCTASPPCSSDATCNDTGPGTYTCTCNAGFTGTGIGMSGCQSHYIQVAVGDTHMCGIRQDDSASKLDGTLWCWGMNNAGQLGNGTTSTSPVTTPVEVTAEYQGKEYSSLYWSYVTAGTQDTCGIVSSSSSNPAALHNSLFCWGLNGTNEQIDTGVSESLLATPVLQGTVVSPIDSEGGHTCALLTSGEIYCWGLNTSGQLGLGSTTPSIQSSPTEVPGQLYPFSSITLGASHTCGIAGTPGGNLIECWGDDTYGELGVPLSSASMSVPFFSAWASGTKYVLGEFVTANGYIWQAVVVNAPDTSASSGSGPAVPTGSTCLATASMEEGGVPDGQNLVWQCMDPISPSTCNTTTSPVICASPSPAQSAKSSTQYVDAVCAEPGCGGTSQGPEGNHSWSSVTAGQFGTCAIQSDESLWCWGANSRGQVGINSNTPIQPVPTAVHDATNSYASWSAVALGSEHACGIESLNQGAVYCWGDNQEGQLGTGSTVGFENVPVPIMAPASATPPFNSIVSNPGSCTSSMTISQCNSQGAYGGIYTCAIDSNNELFCWGVPTNGAIYTFTNVPTLMTQ